MKSLIHISFLCFGSVCQVIVVLIMTLIFKYDKFRRYPILGKPFEDPTCGQFNISLCLVYLCPNFFMIEVIFMAGLNQPKFTPLDVWGP